MSIRAFDRAQDAYNLAKKVAVQEKTIVFVLPRVQLGAFKTEIRFPWEGTIIDVYASAGTEGSGKTRIALEKCSEMDYVAVPNWINVLSSDIVFDANEKSIITSSEPVVIGDAAVVKGDHFRINVVELGDGFQDLTVEVQVAI